MKATGIIRAMKQRLRALGGWWLAWLGLCAAGAVWIARAELARLHNAFDTDARIAHRLLSQQVVQYDAVLATLAMMEGAQKNPAGANLVYLPGFLLLGGGVPIKAGNEVIGALGVGGAPGGHLDEQCANAALDKVVGALDA